MKKQIALLLTVLVLAFTLTACGAQSEGTDGISSANREDLKNPLPHPDQ